METPYNAAKFFLLTSLIGKLPMALVVHPSLPVKNIQEFVAYSKKIQRYCDVAMWCCARKRQPYSYMATEPLKLQELGLKGFLAGTSPEVAELIAKQIQIALKDSKIIEQYDEIGIMIIGADPQEKVKNFGSLYCSLG